MELQLSKLFSEAQRIHNSGIDSIKIIIQRYYNTDAYIIGYKVNNIYIDGETISNGNLSKTFNSFEKNFYQANSISFIPNEIEPYFLDIENKIEQLFSLYKYYYNCRPEIIIEKEYSTRFKLTLQSIGNKKQTRIYTVWDPFVGCLNKLLNGILQDFPKLPCLECQKEYRKIKEQNAVL